MAVVLSMVIGENGGEGREIVCRGLEREGKGNGREREVESSRHTDDSRGGKVCGRFLLSAVNTAHGRRYNWRRPAG